MNYRCQYETVKKEQRPKYLMLIQKVPYNYLALLYMGFFKNHTTHIETGIKRYLYTNIATLILRRIIFEGTKSEKSKQN